MRHIGKNTEGSVFVIVALSMLAIIGAVGVAVDVSREQMVQTKLQSAVDSAALVVGATVNSADVNAVATKYINLNFTQGILGATLGTVTTTISADNQIITMSAQATLPTTFMQVFGRTSMTLAASSEVTRTNKGMELAMVLDTTGSMAGSKIQALQSAAHDLVNILFGDQTTATNLWIGVVPFSQAVNVGTSHTDWLTSGYSSLNWGPTSWAGCVMARWQNGNDVTDATPSTEKFDTYYWASDSYNPWIVTKTNSTTVCSGKNSCSCGSTSNCSCTGSNSSKKCVQTTTTTSYSITSTQGPNAYCPSTITQLSNDKATIGTGIDALAAAGNTHISEGAAWGYRLLSPKWRGVWGNPMNGNNLPLDYNTPLMVKAVIIMTDGENTISNTDKGAYDYLSAGHLGTTNSNTAVTKLNDKLTTVCNALKAQNIIVYTILFEEDDPTAVSLMQSCATSPDYFFESPDEATLQSAFRTIGDSLANLRISH